MTIRKFAFFLGGFLIAQTIVWTGKAFAEDIIIDFPYVQRSGQVVKQTKALKDGDRVLVRFTTPSGISQPTRNGLVGFANQGTVPNDSNEVCLTFQGAGAVVGGNRNPRTVCGLLSGSIQFNSVGGLRPSTSYQAVFVTKGDAPGGIIVKLTPNNA